ncbi:aromatic ring-hydroxylating oxygenase subunit alpha, partial [Pseudomonas aeruginosa]
VIRAFHNSCRHRGSILCQPGSGHAPRIVCPYHNWTYDLEGALLAASRMGEDFDKTKHGLKPLRLEEVAGLLFVCFADEPPPFE